VPVRIALSGYTYLSRPAGDYLTGDGGGTGSRLDGLGRRFFADYNAIMASNVNGGIDSDTACASDPYAGMQLD